LISFSSIGIIHTPYKDIAPFRPDTEAVGEFYIEVFPEYVNGLKELERFSHITILFYLDRTKKHHLIAHPPKFNGRKEVGVFASRSPFRKNKIGMNIVELKRIEGNLIYTSPLDALDNTPLIDIKPYIKDLDCFPEANEGWLND
jgi:tRNA-Thr(GGU) m(6)t(6)A37 methyltransferase TsaA